MIPEEICLRKVDTRRNGSVWKYQGPQGWPSYDSKPAEPMEDLRSGVEAISAGASVSLALCGDGSVLSWGVQDDPCLVEELAGARAVSAGSDHGAAVLADGSVVVWGGSPVVAITDASELGSKLGGLPDLPSGTSWPAMKGTPQAFVCQVNLADLSDLDVESLLPTSTLGLLSFFLRPRGIGLRLRP